MSQIYNANFTAEILTGKMPLSDSFNRSQAATTRMGVHHGLQVQYDDTNWPNKNYSTQYLKIRPGSAQIAATQGNQYANVDPVILSAILTAAWGQIDLDALGILAADSNVYRVVIHIVYVTPIVNELSGLVSNVGSNQVSIQIEQDDPSDTGSVAGLIIGKFCRAHKYVESIGDQCFNDSDINFDNTDGSLPNSMKSASNLGAAVKTSVYNNLSNLRKHIRVSNISDPTVAEQLKTSVMPLTGITGSIASSVGAINSWQMPVDWFNNSASTIIITKGIYRDVEKFELFNCRFKNAMQFAFHRTPGHNKMAEWVGTGSVGNIIDKSQISAYKDRGSQSFTFDAEGSVFEGNLTIDLVLDFTGYAHEHPYKITIKNLKVMGGLVINYGQSLLGMAGGTIGTVEYDNVQVFGGNNKIRPWPCVRSVPVGSGINNTNGWGAYGFDSAEYFDNSAASITFSGYSSSGPALLNYWKVSSGSIITRGVIIPTYMHSKISGTGSMTMGDPWLVEGADAGIVIKNSVMPVTIFGETVRDVDTNIPAPYDAATMIRFKIQNCKYQNNAGSADPFGYLVPATFLTIGDGIYSLSSNDWINIRITNDLDAAGDVNAVNNVTAQNNLLGSAATLTRSGSSLSLDPSNSISGIIGTLVKIAASTGRQIAMFSDTIAHLIKNSLNRISVGSNIDVITEGNLNIVTGAGVMNCISVFSGGKIQVSDIYQYSIAARPDSVYSVITGAYGSIVATGTRQQFLSFRFRPDSADTPVIIPATLLNTPIYEYALYHIDITLESYKRDTNTLVAQYHGMIVGADTLHQSANKIMLDVVGGYPDQTSANKWNIQLQAWDTHAPEPVHAPCLVLDPPTGWAFQDDFPTYCTLLFRQYL